jgi:hypothetical protein
MLKRNLTNFNLLYLAFLGLALCGLIVFWDSNNDTDRPLIVFGIAVAILIVFSVAGAVIQVLFLKDKKSIWMQPVSSATGTIIANVVVVTWLCVVAAIMFLIVSTTSTEIAALAVTLLLLVGIGSAWLLRAKFSKHSLLPYGISFTVALIIVMCVMTSLGLNK